MRRIPMVENDLPTESPLELKSSLSQRVVPASDDPTAADDLKLLPPESPSRQQFARKIDPPVEIVLPPPEPAGRSQFSIGDVMIVMIGVAIGLAGGTWMPADYFAAVLGLVTLVGLLLVHVYPPESHVGKLLWATLVLAYIMAVFAALLRPVVT